jgi:hypothetical protein
MPPEWSALIGLALIGLFALYLAFTDEEPDDEEPDA